MKLIKFFRKTILPVLCLGALASCVVDHSTDIPDSGKGEEIIQLSIDIPGATDAAQSRALADYNAECAVSSIDVLQFTADGKFAYRAQGYNISGEGVTRTFKANLLVGDYDLVLIANARDQVNNAAAGTGGVTKWDENTDIQEALNRLGVTVAATGKITSGGVLSALPMFGITEGVTVQKDLSLTDIQMVRMLSKIEVQLSKKAASGTDGGTGNSNFKLLDARLYNQALTGWVAPNVSLWNTTTNIATTAYYGGGTAPAKASYPANAPIIYSGVADNVTDNDILRSIYTFEAPAGSDAGRNTNVCLVVGGYYNGSAKPSYYRVDFRQLDNGTARYLPLLRNHKYIVNVTSVIGPGYSDPDDAFYGETSQMEVGILDWNDSGMGHVAFDGQHYLSIRPSNEMEFYREKSTQTIEIKTDVTAGWQVTKITSLNGYGTETNISSSGWLTTDKTTGASGSYVKLNVSVAENDTTSPRTGYIYITAGRLTARISVVQLATSNIFININGSNGKEISELIFPANAGEQSVPSQEFNVSWGPKTAAFSVNGTQIGARSFNFGSGHNPLVFVPQNPGMQYYTIQPPAFSAAEIDPAQGGDPFLSKVTKLKFQAEHEGVTKEASIFLSQVNYALVPVGVSDYLLDGNQYSFGIRCNTAWKISSVIQKLTGIRGTTKELLGSTSTDNMKEGQTGGFNVSEAGEEIRFTVAKNADMTKSGTIEVVFVSPTELFKSITVTIRIVNSIWARSNIVWIPDNTLPSKGKLTFAVTPDDNKDIPANSQGVYFKWGSLVAVSPVGVYTTSSMIFSPNDTYNYFEFAGIPYCGDYSNNTEPDEDFFKNYDGSSNSFGPGYNASASKGDICRYISAQGWVEGKWRLPTGAEIEALIGKYYKNSNVEWEHKAPPGGRNTYGFYQLSNGYYAETDASSNPANPTKGVYFPASGYRAENGAAAGTEASGHYWSGSSYNTSNSYIINLSNYGISSNTPIRRTALPVRCVRE